MTTLTRQQLNDWNCRDHLPQSREVKHAPKGSEVSINAGNTDRLKSIRQLDALFLPERILPGFLVRHWTYSDDKLLFGFGPLRLFEFVELK